MLIMQMWIQWVRWEYKLTIWICAAAQNYLKFKNRVKKVLGSRLNCDTKLMEWLLVSLWNLLYYTVNACGGYKSKLWCVIWGHKQNRMLSAKHVGPKNVVRVQLLCKLDPGRDQIPESNNSHPKIKAAPM